MESSIGGSLGNDEDRYPVKGQIYHGANMHTNNILQGNYTSISTVALFITSKTQKELKCPLTDEWLKNMWYVYTTEYPLAMG